MRKDLPEVLAVRRRSLGAVLAQAQAVFGTTAGQGEVVRGLVAADVPAAAVREVADPGQQRRLQGSRLGQLGLVLGQRRLQFVKPLLERGDLRFGGVLADHQHVAGLGQARDLFVHGLDRAVLPLDQDVGVRTFAQEFRKRSRVEQRVQVRDAGPCDVRLPHGLAALVLEDLQLAVDRVDLPGGLVEHSPLLVDRGLHDLQAFGRRIQRRHQSALLLGVEVFLLADLFQSVEVGFLRLRRRQQAGRPDRGGGQEREDGSWDPGFGAGLHVSISNDGSRTAD